MEITFELEGLDKVIGAWKAHRKWLEQTLPHINPIIETSIFMNYMSEGRPKWKQRQQEYAWPILWKTGAKRALELASAQAPFFRSGDEYVLNIISTWYGGFHQRGTTNLPERKSAKLTRDEREQARLTFIRDWIHYFLNR